MAPRNPATLLFEKLGTPERIQPLAPAPAPRLATAESWLPLEQRFNWEELSWISGISISRLRQAYTWDETAVLRKKSPGVTVDPAGDYSTIT